MKRLLVILPILFFTCEPAMASHENRLRLVQVLLGEAGWRPTNDHPAILHVLERRRHLPAFEGSSLTKMAKTYSAFLKPNPKKNDLPHRQAIYSLTLDTAPQWTVRLVDDFLFDLERVKDPCKGQAWNWGSLEDTLVTKKERVDCGPTLNVFLGLKVRKVEVR